MRTELTAWQSLETGISIGSWNAMAQGLGGWTLDVHHFYDPDNGELYLGDGSQRTPKGMVFDGIFTVADNGTGGYGRGWSPSCSG